MKQALKQLHSISQLDLQLAGHFGLERIMRYIAVSFMALAAIGLSGCAGFGKKKPEPPPMEEEAAPPKPVANNGTEVIDPSTIQETPKKPGFFSGLSKALGTGNDIPNVGPCPSVKVLYDASRFVEVTGDLKFENVGFTGEIQKIKSACRYIGTDPITVGMAIDMALGKGPKADGDRKLVKYWIVVTRKDVAPIFKKDFVGEVYFPKGADRTELTTPEVTIEIPRANKDVSGANFEVLVGFELTEDQLKFNRDGIRFKIDAGAKN